MTTWIEGRPPDNPHVRARRVYRRRRDAVTWAAVGRPNPQLGRDTRATARPSSRPPDAAAARVMARAGGSGWPRVRLARCSMPSRPSPAAAYRRRRIHRLPIGCQFLAVEGLSDANPMVRQELLVYWKDLQAGPRGRCREDLQSRRVAGDDRRTELRQPARLAQVNARFSADIRSRSAGSVPNRCDQPVRMITTSPGVISLMPPNFMASCRSSTVMR